MKKPPAENATKAAEPAPDYGPNTKKVEVVALSLSCALDDEQRDQKYRAALAEMDLRDQTLERHAETKATMKGELVVHNTEIKKLRTQATTGFETRPVTCDVVFDFDRGLAVTIRRDTGEEVKTRTLQAHERQTSIVEDDPDEGLAAAFTAGQAAGRDGSTDNPYPDGAMGAEWDRGRRSVSSAAPAPKPAKAKPAPKAPPKLAVAPSAKAPE